MRAASPAAPCGNGRAGAGVDGAARPSDEVGSEAPETAGAGAGDDAGAAGDAGAPPIAGAGAGAFEAEGAVTAA
ncbi:hypothetical protein, partial [Candidatus Collinsella stercoripullorum]|uniref:hypothetical protein n=1 Tax=Candidatus Collinsella stercoripullorum TaxID=2838522 RepID=UPI0022E133CC